MAVSGRSAFAVWSDLIKARLTVLVLLTDGWRDSMSAEGLTDWTLLFTRYLHRGGGLRRGGAESMVEREHDAKMTRTPPPLPANSFLPATVRSPAELFASAAWSACLVRELLRQRARAIRCSATCSFTLRQTSHDVNTAVGGFRARCPPLMGWAAARDNVSREGWGAVRDFILLALPHFLAIGVALSRGATREGRFCHAAGA